MAPVLHCIRHAQGYHNLNTANHSIQDPLLTPLGEEQCAILAKAFPYQDRISRVVASPLRRTIYTALLSLDPAISSKKLTVIALPELQETSDVPCDTGSNPDVLRKEIDEKKLPVDLSLVKDGWNDKSMGTKWAPTSRAISARAKDARIWLRNLAAEMVKNGEEGDVVMVSHGGYLHYFTEDWEDSGVHAGTGWANTEYRSYTFNTLAPETPSTTKPSSAASSTEELDSTIKRPAGLAGYEDDYENASITETPESRTRRGKGSKAPSRVEQYALFQKAMQGWEDQGLQNASKLSDKEGSLITESPA